MRATAVSLSLLTLAALGCSGDRATTSLQPDAAAPSMTAPAAPTVSSSSAAASRTTASERWNVLTREIVSRREFGPLGLARTFAMVSVAQYDAVIATSILATRRVHPSEPAAAGAASAAVLAAIYPMEQAVIDAQLAADSSALSAASRHDDLAEGFSIGRRVAVAVLARGAADGSTTVWTGTTPVGPGYWFSAPLPARALAPGWGTVRPWLMTSGHQFRPAAPPAYGSPAFQAALAEVRHYSDTRTPAQLTIAQFWGAVNGTAGPPGYWSEVALKHAAAQHFDERSTARMLATMHMAGMDASIGCWDAKYAYWYVRPYQADPAITTPVGRPNFPSYPSAHSCFSAAFGGVLSAFFPRSARDFISQVDEAGVSRIYAGLHYKFDVTAGNDIGYRVALLALRRVPLGLRPIPLD